MSNQSKPPYNIYGSPVKWDGNRKEWEFLGEPGKKIIPDQLYSVLISNCDTDDKGQLIPFYGCEAVVEMKGSEISRLLKEGFTFP